MNSKTHSASLLLVIPVVLVGCFKTENQTQTQTAASTQSLSPENLSRHTIERRAVEAVIWGMPAVNYEMMLQAGIRSKAGPNQIVFWSHLPNWKNQTLTPNPDAIYFMPFFNTKDAGPVVLEVPPAGDDGLINGNLDDTWQVALEDVGPAGADKGRGGKYLILPPGYKDKVPGGYIVLPSDTYADFGLLRSILKGGSQTDVAKAVAYGRRVKLYPLSQASHPPETKFVDVVDDLFDSTIPYDERFFESLNRMVQSEPWLERDRAMIDQLKSLGIEKGKPFAPGAPTQESLKQGALEAHAWLEANYEGVFKPSFYAGEQWALPVSPEVVEGQANGYPQRDIYPIDARGITYFFAFIGAKRLGSGQYYLMTIKDSQGQSLDGSSTYQLKVPANVPITQYWSATVYDRATHAFIRNMPYPSRSSQTPGLQKDAGGSVSIYFAPKAPSGKESNWIPTDAKGKFEVMLRFYGPQKPLFDKTWKLPDIEKAN